MREESEREINRESGREETQMLTCVVLGPFKIQFLSNEEFICIDMIMQGPGWSCSRRVGNRSTRPKELTGQQAIAKFLSAGPLYVHILVLCS